MIRRIDELGRIVIPKEIRKQLNIQNDTPIEIQIQNNKIILVVKKETIECQQCGAFMSNGDKYCSQCGKQL